MIVDYKEMVETVLTEKVASQGLHLKDIANRIMESHSGGLFDESPLVYDDVYKNISALLSREVRKTVTVFSKVKNSKTKKDKKGFYKIKKANSSPLPSRIKPIEIEEPKATKPQSKNLFTGKAGECAVMSELLFRAYNVNSMLVDDGIDIVASKNNVFYYIQVKTTLFEADSKIHTSIKQVRFNDFLGTQIKYIVVARCSVNNVDTNMYFVFSNSDIEKFIYNRTMKIGDSGILIKIEIDPTTKRPMLYDEKREDISFYLNNFKL
ncbi:MAG: hypothetical protein WCL70_01435 [Paludibacter sp.]